MPTTGFATYSAGNKYNRQAIKTIDRSSKAIACAGVVLAQKPHISQAKATSRIRQVQSSNIISGPAEH